MMTITAATEAVPRQHQQQHAGQDQQPLLEPFKMGGFQLTDRIVYAPLTRCRAINNVPSAAAVEYYSQRARPGGFMISEATVTSPTGYGCGSLALLSHDDEVCASTQRKLRRNRAADAAQHCVQYDRMRSQQSQRSG